MEKGFLTKRQVAANWTDFEITQGSFSEPSLPPQLIHSALIEGGLPRIETEGSAALILLRVFDHTTANRLAGTRELTRKLGIFIHDNRITTLHSFSFSAFPSFYSDVSNANPDEILNLILDRVIQGYSEALTRIEDEIELLELAVFQPKQKKPLKIRDAYSEKRRLNVIRKMMKLQLELIDSVATLPESEKNRFGFRKNQRKKTSLLLSRAESAIEGMNQLLGLQLALESQKTNGVMRVLTVFSAFFLPLSFIAGVYGMNFEVMPELKHPLGYFGALAFMGVISGGIAIWFKKRGLIGAR